MKKVITVILLGTLLSIALCFSNVKYKNVLLFTSSNGSYQNVKLSDISSAKVANFDNPKVEENGILQRVQTVDINTKYGTMQILKEQYGYLVTNLTNKNAPKLNVGTLNGIFEIGGASGVSELIAPKVIDESTGTKIILPSIDTKEQNFNATYVEAINSKGDITIAPFVYNTIKFKDSINVANENDIKNLKIADVLEGTNNSTQDLKMYIANTNNNMVNIGISRGMTSVQKSIRINVGSNKVNIKKTDVTKTNIVTKNNETIVSKIVLGKIAYIIVGIILCVIIAFFCFIYKKKSRKKIGIGIILITITIVGLGFIHQYLNFTYGTYLDSGYYNQASGGVISQLDNIITGDAWKKPIEKVGNLKKDYENAKSINSSVAGWIFIDGTNINYPIMHGKDDEYYLTHNWEGKPFWNGSVFLDHANSGFNNVSLINGHNMLNGIMFSELINFKNKEFFDGNHKIYIYNGETNKEEVFDAIGALYCEPTIKLDLGEISDSAKALEVKNLMNKSMYAKENYNGNDVLLLNTCLSNGSGKHLLVITEEVK